MTLCEAAATRRAETGLDAPLPPRVIAGGKKSPVVATRDCDEVAAGISGEVAVAASDANGPHRPVAGDTRDVAGVAGEDHDLVVW